MIPEKKMLFWLSKVNNGLAWKNRRHFATPPTATSRNGVRPKRRNSILIARHYQDLGTDSDWSCRVLNLLQPIRSTTQIWVVRRHQYGISALVSQTSFRGKTVGGVAKCLFLFRRMMDLLKVWKISLKPKKSLSFVGLIILAMQHIMNKYISRDSVKYRTLRWACNLLLILYFCCFGGFCPMFSGRQVLYSHIFGPLKRFKDLNSRSSPHACHS